MEMVVTFKREGKKTQMSVGGFTGDPAMDMSRFSRKELESILNCDKNSPIMIRVK
ncbi:hypothetical protein NVP1178O_74 [Vibrio phage 1.178.O._10N.286.45.E12]|nr:hypothetical protein NVP1178O_74 [Vibrio phage 1.178.O._10N.286.45.E12]